MDVKARFIRFKETKGTVRYAEVDSAGDVIEDYNKFVIGNLYLRKHLFSRTSEGNFPEYVDVTVHIP